jgi:hypothetical protein
VKILVSSESVGIEAVTCASVNPTLMTVGAERDQVRERVVGRIFIDVVDIEMGCTAQRAPMTCLRLCGLFDVPRDGGALLDGFRLFLRRHV